METSQSAGLAKFENLEAELQAAESNAFGGKLPAGVKRNRESLIRAISKHRGSSLQIGLLAAKYRDHYKAEQAWMPVGQSIARVLGYRSYTSLNCLMKTALRASRLSRNLLAAVIEEGIDLAEHKYKSILDELVSCAFSGTDDKARVVARTAIAAFNSRKQKAAETRRKAKIAAARQIEIRIASQVKRHLTEASPKERQTQADAILSRLTEAIQTVLPEYKLRTLREQADQVTSRRESSSGASDAGRGQSEDRQPTEREPNRGRPKSADSSRSKPLPFRPKILSSESRDGSPTRHPKPSEKKAPKPARPEMPTLFDMAPFVAVESRTGKQ